LTQAIDDAFARVLDQQMDYYNYSPEADEIRNIKSKLSEVGLLIQNSIPLTWSQVMDVMVNNIDKVLDRGEKIEVLVNQTNKLQTSSYRMTRSATKLKKRLWWKNVYLYCLPPSSYLIMQHLKPPLFCLRWMCIIFCCIVLLLVIAAIAAVVLWKVS